MTPFSPRPVEQLAIFNLTTDSFSDGGELLSPQEFNDRLGLWTKSGSNFILDIGAESTAPQSQKISSQLEWERLEHSFLPHFDLWKSHSALSIDSYHPETIERLQSWLALRGRGPKLIWNDVSGKIDDDCVRVLKSHKDLTYILCHNLAPSRAETSDHMNYAYSENNLSTHIREWFEQKLELVRSHELSHQLWLDPCFGFSKNEKDNWKLLEALPSLCENFSSYPWVIGLSRKSFLRKRLLAERPELKELSRPEFNNHLDAFQFPLHRELKSRLPHPLIFRVHCPLEFEVGDEA